MKHISTSVRYLSLVDETLLLERIMSKLRRLYKRFVKLIEGAYLRVKLIEIVNSTTTTVKIKMIQRRRCWSWEFK